MTVVRRPYTIFVYDRQARSDVSAALKASGFLSLGTWLKRKNQAVPHYEYRSRDALVRDGVPRYMATPRYLGEATDAEMRRVMDELKRIDPSGEGIEIYHD